jgi:uncharacterized membrane protein
MSPKAAITVGLPREEVQRLWASPEYRPHYIAENDAVATFTDAPGDRGTEIHVDLAPKSRGGKLGEVVRKVSRTLPRAKVMDELRRFKQLAETGEIARSEAAPEGELAKRKLRQRPARAPEESELEKVGA